MVVVIVIIIIAAVGGWDFQRWRYAGASWRGVRSFVFFFSFFRFCDWVWGGGKVAAVGREFGGAGRM